MHPFFLLIFKRSDFDTKGVIYNSQRKSRIS